MAISLVRPLSVSGAAFSIVVLLILGQAVTEYVAHLSPATVIVDDVPRRVHTRCSTVGQLLGDLGVVIKDGDRVSPALDTPIESEMTIVVRRARSVAVVADGAVREVYTHRTSAGEILAEASVDLRPGDEVLVNGTRTADRSELPVSRIEVRRALAIYVVDGENGGGSRLVHTLYTTAETVEQALARAQVLLYAGDQVYPGLDAPVSTGMQIHIRRAMPVLVYVDGRIWRTRTLSATVGEVLAELGISLLALDYSEPSPDTVVQDGLSIRVVRVAERKVVEQTEIPYETVWVPDPELELDHRRLDDAGANGIMRRRYKITYHDGHEIDRHLEAEWTAREPRKRQIVYGTRIVVRTIDTPHGPIEYWRRIRVFRTAYTAATCGKEPDDPLYGITRLGWKMRHGIIAVDPRVIQLRSNLYVPGYGPGIAGDTGSLIKGRHIDLGYEVDHMVWHYEWGYVYVLAPVPPARDIPYILSDYPRER